MGRYTYTRKWFTLEDSKCGWHEGVIKDALMLVTRENKERGGGRSASALLLVGGD